MKINPSSVYLYRYFKHNANGVKVKKYIQLCSRGDWFVLYQLSKNLNRPFFMDFLITLATTGKHMFNFLKSQIEFKS